MDTTQNDFSRARLRLVQEVTTTSPKSVSSKRAQPSQPLASADAADAAATAVVEEQLRQAILALPLDNCGLTVRQALQECSERFHEESTATIFRLTFLDSRISDLGLFLQSVDPNYGLTRECFLHLTNPKLLLARHPELASLDPMAHAGLTLG